MGDSLPLIISVIVVVLLFSLLRRRGGTRNQPDMIQAILFDVKLNQVLIDTYHRREKPKKFERTNWLLYKDKISFLKETLKENLKEAFALVDDINQQIQFAKKSKSESYKNIDLSKLRELLIVCREGLEEWMVDNTGQKELPPRYPSLTGFLFGER